MASNACLLARHKLASTVAALRKSSVGEKTSSTVKAAWLSNPIGLARDVATNTATLGAEYLATQPVAVGMDYMAALAKSAFTGRPAHEFRTVARIPVRKGAAVAGKGFAKGAKMGKEYLKTGFDPRNVAKKTDYRETTFDKKYIDKTVKTIFRLRGIPDYPFSEAAFNLSMYEQSRLRAIREGLKGSSIEKRADELMKAPSEEMVARAGEDAMKVSFRQETTMGNFLSGIKDKAATQANKAKGMRKVGAELARVTTDLTIPFTQFASAAVSTGLEYSPAGFVKALVASIADRGLGKEREIRKILSRATLGSGLAYLAYAKAREGELTGAPPRSRAEREQWDLEGKKPFSVRIGDKWVSYLWLGPGVIPMVMGYSAGSTDDDTVSGKIGAAASGAVGSIAEQTGLTGIKDMIGNLDPESPGQLANAAVGFAPIPAAATALATLTDPTRRDVSGSPLDRLQNRIPGASKMLPSKRDQFGGELRRRDGIGSYISPAQTSAASQDPVVNELARIGAHASPISKKVSRRGRSFERSPAEYNALLAEYGPQKREALEKLMNSQTYQGLTDERKKMAVEKILSNVNRYINNADFGKRIRQ